MYEYIPPIKVPVQIEVTVHIKQAQIVPFLGLKPLREKFDISAFNRAQKYYRASEIDPRKEITRLRQWVNRRAGGDLSRVLELHLPTQNWSALKKDRRQLLTDPSYKTALFFVGGKRFNQITGHPDGTEIWVIDDVLYRAMTWRSITTTYWDKKRRDSKIVWRENDHFVYFLHRCEKINEDPLKSTIVDAVGLEILERDKPKEVTETAMPW